MTTIALRYSPSRLYRHTVRRLDDAVNRHAQLFDAQRSNIHRHHDRRPLCTTATTAGSLSNRGLTQQLFPLTNNIKNNVTMHNQHRRWILFHSSSNYNPSFITSTTTSSIQFSTNAAPTEDNNDDITNTTIESNEKLFPEGVIRQSDFFEEPITFIKNVDSDCFVHSTVDQPFFSKSPQPEQIAQLQKQQQQQLSAHSHHDKHKTTDSLNVINALSSFDGMSMCIISRGSANLHEGNDGDGPEAKAMHSSALAWGELLEYSWEWNSNGKQNNNNNNNNHHGNGTMNIAAPMLAVAAVAPVVAQGGRQYLHRIDKWLTKTGMPQMDQSPPSLWDMACHAVSYRDVFLSTKEQHGTSPSSSSTAAATTSSSVPLLTCRERWHLHALYQLLQNNHEQAMGAYCRLLELYPGDLLGLSLALDVAHTLGDSEAALRAATNVSTYWSERDGGHLHLNPSHPGQTLATSLIAVGLSSSASSRASTAERLAESALARDSQGAGGTSVWALSHSLAAEGRSSEMVSKLAGFDGAQFYEACGYLNFHNRMAGYGGIALLDQRRSGAERAAVRLYDGGFGRVLEYSGNDVQGVERGGEDVCLEEKRVPRNVKKDMAGAVGSLFSGWFGGGGDKSESQSPKVQSVSDGSISNEKEGTNERKQHQVSRRAVEDVLCWLPPSPILLTNATALLLRLTLCDGIAPSDQRWADLTVAWKLALQTDSQGDDTSPNVSSIGFMPLASVASSLLLDPSQLISNDLPHPTLLNAMHGLHKMGKLMKLGESYVATSKRRGLDSSSLDEWKVVMQHLANARDSSQRWELSSGMSSATYSHLITDGSTDSSIRQTRPIGWDLDTRQFLEYALCHAAMEVGDHESLCLARAICSEGTTLRSNCPEVWWRYARVLDRLGDEVAAENARAASVSLGSGEGGSTF